MTETEIVKICDELSKEGAEVTAEKERIIGEIEGQNKVREQAKRDRDIAADAGDKVAWGLAMDDIAKVTKELAGLGNQYDILREKVIKRRADWQPLVKLIAPLLDAAHADVDKLNERVKGLERTKSRIYTIGSLWNEIAANIGDNPLKAKSS